MTNPQPGPMPPPQQPGPYSQQPYPQYAGVPNAAGAGRPGIVTGAAVIAFVVGGLTILFGLLAFGLLSSLGVGGFYTVLLIISIAAGAVMIWGGVQALNGKDGRILVIAAGVAILANLITMIMAFTTTGLLSFVLPILIVALMMQAQSRNWIRSRGGQTF